MNWKVVVQYGVMFAVIAIAIGLEIYSWVYDVGFF